MRVFSFIDDDNIWTPVEVELELWPGLPEIHFLGRADQHLRESAKRIKSAVRAQGFEFPSGQQILVNLRPSYLKKSSRGLELAVAVAFLIESGQLPRPNTSDRIFYYGELGLTGEVRAPEGLRGIELKPEERLVTGVGCENLGFDFQELADLRALSAPVPRQAQALVGLWAPPDDFLDWRLPQSWARTLGILALGRHSALFAGPAGSGKTTAGKILHALMAPPSGAEARELLRRLTLVGAEGEVRVWRPLVQPHHTIPTLSLVGGGNEVHGGELARADLGLLLLDEFFEFSAGAIEALREPLEQSRFRISRGARVREFPLRAQVIATTNLCPCGEFVPGLMKKKRCRFTLAKCRSYSQKISGPLLDRFQALIFTKPKTGSEAPWTVRELLDRLQEKRARLQAGGRDLENEPLAAVRSRLEPFLIKDWESRSLSERRRSACLRVAQSVADWEGCEMIRGPHFEEALHWTLHNFEKLRRWED